MYLVKSAKVWVFRRVGPCGWWSASTPRISLCRCIGGRLSWQDWPIEFVQGVLRHLAVRFKDRTAPGKLARHEPRIEAPPSEQGIVASGFSDSPIRHHDDKIGVADRRKAVSNNDCGPFVHQFPQRGTDGLLVDGVEMGGGFIQDQDRRVLQKGAGNRHPLALSARQAHAALADRGVPSVGQSGDERRQRGPLQRLGEVSIVRVRLGDQDIGAQGVVKQIGVLRDKRDAFAQVVGPIANGAGDRAEDRERFQRLINRLGLRQPDNGVARSEDDAVTVAESRVV
mgnify:CR=1 FL=1